MNYEAYKKLKENIDAVITAGKNSFKRGFDVMTLSNESLYGIGVMLPPLRKLMR